MNESEGQPTRLDDCQVCIPQIFANHARTLGDKPALVCGTQVRTWREFDANMSRVANSLLARGIGHGRTVAVLMNSGIDIVEVMFGVVRAGACVVPLSGLLTSDQVKTLLLDSNATALFCARSQQEKVDECRSGLPNIRSDQFFSTDFEAPGWIHSASLMATASDAFPRVNYRQDDAFSIIYSSGTTGLPKGIVQTHRARLHWAFSNAIDLGFHVTAKGLTSTALYSNGTWLTMLPTLFVGATLYVMPEFKPSLFLDMIQKNAITPTFTVPTQLILSLGELADARYDLSSLQSVLCAGSTLRNEVRREVLEKITPNLYYMYGFSEGFATMCKPWQHATKGESVGLPVLGFEVMIVDDEGTELPWGETGEIAGYGAGLMQTYHNREDLTAALIVADRRGRTFFRSGDIGRIDDDGFLYVVDRKKGHDHFRWLQYLSGGHRSHHRRASGCSRCQCDCHCGSQMGRNAVGLGHCAQCEGRRRSHQGMGQCPTRPAPAHQPGRIGPGPSAQRPGQSTQSCPARPIQPWRFGQRRASGIFSRLTRLEQGIPFDFEGVPDLGRVLSSSCRVAL